MKLFVVKFVHELFIRLLKLHVPVCFDIVLKFADVEAVLSLEPLPLTITLAGFQACGFIDLTLFRKEELF